MTSLNDKDDFIVRFSWKRCMSLQSFMVNCLRLLPERDSSQKLDLCVFNMVISAQILHTFYYIYKSCHENNHIDLFIHSLRFTDIIIT